MVKIKTRLLHWLRNTSQKTGVNRDEELERLISEVCMGEPFNLYGDNQVLLSDLGNVRATIKTPFGDKVVYDSGWRVECKRLVPYLKQVKQRISDDLFKSERQKQLEKKPLILEWLEENWN